MSNTDQILIDPANVIAVLLADGWHHVNADSFTFATLRFGDDVGAPGYRFEEADAGNPYGPTTLSGPLEAVLSVRQVTRRTFRQHTTEPTWSRTRAGAATIRHYPPVRGRPAAFARESGTG